MSYLLGNQIRLSVVITATSTGVATDPAALNPVLAIRNLQTSVVVTYTYTTDVALVRDSAGHFHLDYTPAAAGEYSCRWSCTGAVVVASEDSFTVIASVVV